MGAKDIVLKPITPTRAREAVVRLHYSGTYVNNTQLNIGVFLNGDLEGVMMFGPSMDKSKIQGLVRGTGWNEFIELNRMAFSDRLPRNSESRAIAVAMKLLKKHAPHIKWVVSFADAAQCGDGTIYRASGFVLTGVKQNNTLYRFPTGDVIAGMTLEANFDSAKVQKLCADMGVVNKYRTRTAWRKLGARPVPGYQLRYLYFLDKTARARLAVPEIPFNRIDEIGARMYKGVPLAPAPPAATRLPGADGGAKPTPGLDEPRRQ